MQCTGVPSSSCRAGRCGCILAVSTAVLFSHLQSLLFRHCDSVAAQHAVSGAHQHAVGCSPRDVEKCSCRSLCACVSLIAVSRLEIQFFAATCNLYCFVTVTALLLSML